MKKILFALLLIVFAKANAQINYEHTYVAPYGEGNNIFLAHLGANEEKYVVWDYNQGVFSMYNLDHTPFMLNISIPVSDSALNYSIGYITRSLFDCDSTNIEYMILSGNPYVLNVYIYRTDGTFIFEKDSATTLWCVGCLGGTQEMKGIENTAAGTKLYLVNEDYATHTEKLFVYGLCGTLPEEITEINQSASFVRVFPNPTSNQINFEITPPGHLGKYELMIYNSSFQTINTTVIDGANTHINLDSEHLSSGEYFYSLQTKNKVFQHGKFVLTK